jgi:hypothetical protein
MDSTTLAPDAAVQTKRSSPLVDFARFVAAVGALAAAAFLTLAAIVYFMPEQNDYALATLRKHERLATSPGRRLVLVGGSNLAFGVDSGIIARETELTPVNMGMNGYFGVRYMLEEVKPDLRAGDVVVIAFEWDNYFKPIEGANADLLMVVKANPAAFGYLSWRERARVLGRGLPYVAQQKALRVLRAGVNGLRDALRGRAPAEDHGFALVSQIERASGFTPAGDLVSHLGISWPYEREQGLDLTARGIDPVVIGYIQAFAREMEARDVTVVVSYSPVLRSFYQRHAAVIDEVHRRMNANGLLAPRPPGDYVYDESLFFDTVYHLNAAGRGPRTEQLVGDVESVLAQRAAAHPPRSQSQ